MSLNVSPASADERIAALGLFFQHLPAKERQMRVERGLGLIVQGELPGEGLLICRSGDTMVGAITALPLAGGAGLLWPPQVSGLVAQEPIEDLLVESANAWLRQRGAKFVQALLSDADAPFAPPLQRHGFHFTTNLLYLQKNLSEHDNRTRVSSRLRFEAYSACDQEVFQRVLLDSYEMTLDCPELNDLRSGEEVVAGYRGMPGCNLDRWWLARQATQPVGVVLTVPAQEPATWELAYLGLAPSARGQALGMELTVKAMEEARTAGAKQLTLTVDARNEPAKKIYHQLGFVEFDRRQVLLQIFGKV